MGRPRH